MQGVVVGIVALYFYGDAVRRLGASRAAVLGSFTPVVAALAGIPLLGELPSTPTWFAIAAVSVGVVLASSGDVRYASSKLRAKSPGCGPQR